jgi:hypothetical protein
MSNNEKAAFRSSGEKVNEEEQPADTLETGIDLEELRELEAKEGNAATMIVIAHSPMIQRRSLLL